MPTGAPAALFVNDIINKHINAGHFQAGCMFNFIFNAVGNALRDGSDVQAIPHFDVQGDDQPPFLLAYGNAFFGQGAVAQRFALWFGQAQRSITPEQRDLFRKIAVYIAQNGSCDIRGLIQTMPEVAGSRIRFCKSAAAANKELFTLNEFILKAA